MNPPTPSSSATPSLPRCDWCQKPASNTTILQRCSACQHKKYCSKTCQKYDWKNGGHKDACQTLQAMKRAVNAVTVRRGPNDPFWTSFWDQATLENVTKLYHDEIGLWQVTLDGDNNNLVVTDVASAFCKEGDDSIIVGQGPCPETSEDVLRAIYACMILPETDHCPRRPNCITLDMKLVNKHYKYLWSELLRVPLAIWPDSNEGQQKMRLCAAFPNRRWGEYAKGEVFYEPQLKLRIEWLDDEKRRDCMENGNGWGNTEEFARDSIDLGYDLEEKQPRWKQEYESWEECLDNLSHQDISEEEKQSMMKHMKEEICDWQHVYNSLEDLCMDMYGAKTIAECAWDYVGIPRLCCEDENAESILKSAGWVCQGYKAGRCFVMSEDSVKLGQRLVHVNGCAWEEPKRQTRF